MRRNLSALALVVMFLFVLSLAFQGLALAKGGGGGFSGGRSSSSSSGGWGGSSRSSSSGGWGGSSRSSGSSSSGGSSSRSSGSSSSGWGSKSAAPSRSSGFGGSATKATSSRTTSTAASRALYDRAKTNGTAFQSRDMAASNFKAKYGSQYTNRFSSQPKTRPDYIPQNTSVGGRNYTVVYNQGFGGYGYYGPNGRWMMYDVMSDMMMMNMLMGNHGYYYGAPPAHTPLWLIILVTLIICFVFAMILAAMFRNR